MNRRFQLASGILFGASMGLVIAMLAGTTLKRALCVAAVACFVMVLAVVKDRVRLCMGTMIFLIPFNINYYLFARYSFHIGGAIGLYLLPMDLPLAYLLGSWFFEWCTTRARPFRLPHAAKFFLPFFFVEAVSVIYALKPSWAAYELVRWIRFLLVILYIGVKIRPADVRFCLKAVAGSALFQACLAMAQTVFRSNFGMDRLGIVGKGSESVFIETVGDSGIVRGAGTTGHPNALAPFLLLSVFIFFLFALVEPRRKNRLLWTALTVLLTGGVAVTLSRAAWISFVIGGAMVLVLSMYAHLLSARRALLVAFVCLITMAAAALPFADQLAERWSGRLDEAIDMRVKLARSALEIVRDHPIGGVGLNNFTVAYRAYDPATAKMFEEQWGTVPAVHNIFLLVWGETGTVGFAAYLAFWIISFFWSMIYLRKLGPLGRCVVVGMWCGIVAVLISDMTSFGFWTEPVMYTAAVLFGLLEPLRLASSSARMAPSEGDMQRALSFEPEPEPVLSGRPT